MVAEPLPAFSGSRPRRGPARGRAEAKEWHGSQDAADAGAERQPVGRETAPEGLRALLGCGVGARVTRRTSLALPAGLVVLVR
jgi:hypothetical protein